MISFIFAMYFDFEFLHRVNDLLSNTSSQVYGLFNFLTTYVYVDEEWLAR